MVKHIVLFQLDPTAPAAERQAAAEAFKAGIEALPATISCIRTISVGFNLNPAEKFDICLEGTFDSLDDVNAYSAHPAHKAVAGALKPLIAARSCVDVPC